MSEVGPLDIGSIVERRRRGETWKKLAAEVGVTGEQLRKKVSLTHGKVELYPRNCKYCGDSFVPDRNSCQHCRKPDCYTQHRKNHWSSWDRRRGARPEPKENEMQVACIGRFCGHKTFTTPIVNDHGRKRPLHRVCPSCRSRNNDYCTAWGGY